ncbi:hypothetical protein [Sporosarcina sp. NPDC096371]|uniref:hypothetical protein n=1 Tax=Sporosarcina sp. NPDC096371 TaxID=3364530 RepID=UPI00381962F0
MPIAAPQTLSESQINSFIIEGEVVQTDSQWQLISGTRRTTFDLPSTMLDTLQFVAKQEQMTMSEFVEVAIREKLGGRVSVK